MNLNQEMPTMAASAYSSSAVHLSDAAAKLPFFGALQNDAFPMPITAIKESTVPRRLVQVFIADTNENVPLDKSLLYRGEQHLTDLTDQELFFEIDIRSILEKHNAERIKLINKAVKDRTEHLEPARVRDLKMVVVAVANF